MLLKRFATSLTSRNLKFSHALYNQLAFYNSDAPAKKSFYKILNLSSDATSEEIKKNYLDLAKKYHPDTAPNDASLSVSKYLQPISYYFRKNLKK